MNRDVTAGHAAAIAAALLDPAAPCPPNLCARSGADPARRFAVYRNNVVVSLVAALGETFPVCRELVGAEFFEAMARLHVRASPPDSPVLAHYGADFPAFIAAFPPAASLPYLADVARLEYARVQACHAAAPPPGGDDVAYLIESRYAIVSLWAAHQGHGAIADVDPSVAEAALIRRRGAHVEVLRVSPAALAREYGVTASTRRSDIATGDPAP